MVPVKVPLVEIDIAKRWPEMEKLAKEEYFKALLRSRRWTRGDTEVAEAAGVSPPTIASWFRELDMERPYARRR